MVFEQAHIIFDMNLLQQNIEEGWLVQNDRSLFSRLKSSETMSCKFLILTLYFHKGFKGF